MTFWRSDLRSQNLTKEEEVGSKLPIDLVVNITNCFLEILFKKTTYIFYFSCIEFDPGILTDESEIEYLDGLRIMYEEAHAQHKEHSGLPILFLCPLSPYI